MFHIIDDEESILEFFSSLIEEAGFEVMTFSCPMDYLSYVDSPEYGAPIALFSDVCMPKMDGFQMLKKIRSKHPDIRVAMISGYYENRIKAKENACVFLHKPVDIDVFIRTVENFSCCHESGPSSKEYKCNAEVEKYDCPHTSHCKNC